MLWAGRSHLQNHWFQGESNIISQKNSTFDLRRVPNHFIEAADGLRAQSKEGGLGVEVILHLEEFSLWPQWLITGKQAFFLKINDTRGTRQFHFSSVF